MLQFKELPEKEKYFDRPGSYAILPVEDKIVLVKIIGWGKYFLPGGGIDKGEDAIPALKREIEEETGYQVTVGNKFCEAAEYVYSPIYESWVNKIGQFYTAEITGQNTALIVEEDHEIVFMSKEDAMENLYMESHQWAVRQWINNNNNE